jgi:hypothetical protein
MNSLDANILFYGINRDCMEYKASRKILDFLPAGEAAQVIHWYGISLGGSIVPGIGIYGRVTLIFTEPTFPSHRVFDAVLSITLKAQGVTIFTL